VWVTLEDGHVMQKPSRTLRVLLVLASLATAVFAQTSATIRDVATDQEGIARLGLHDWWETLNAPPGDVYVSSGYVFPYRLQLRVGFRF